MSIIEDLKNRNRVFQQSVLIDFKEQIQISVENGQKPQVLLISCCDSRVTTDFMFGNKPGELFVIRNIGNFVPSYDSDIDFCGVGAAIEYAVNILNVAHIIVCGHSYCGACESLYADIPDENPNIQKWLKLGQSIKNFTLKNSKHKTKEDLYRNTEKNSIIFQLENLKTYPIINKRLKNKTLEIHGWYYSLTDGSIFEFNQETKGFEKI